MYGWVRKEGERVQYFSKRVAVAPVHWLSVEGASPGCEEEDVGLLDMVRIGMSVCGCTGGAVL